ncbi:MAG: oligosaccharide flippase family protein [Gammaproteobacteria bacterium]|nr:oligosaccharide flippase family protein [Gammaproteobacteria bacterium]MCF6259428.1 oligosaccharide flippase family protein [Gammaproteobacteria bacterium]
MIHQLRRLPDGLKQAILYGTSIALMKGVSLLMLPFIAYHLSPEEFGRLEVISTFAIIGSILVGMGMENTLFRFAGMSRNAKDRQRLAAEIFTLTLIIGSTAWLIGWFAAELIASWIPGNPSPYELRLVISMLALEGCISIPLGWLRMRNRATHFFLATVGRALAQALLVVILLNLDRGVEGVLEAGLIAAVVQALILSYLHIRDTGFGLSRTTGVRTLIYSLPLVGSGLVAFALNGLDRWILADYASLTDVAQFAVAAKFALAVVLLLQPFGMWWLPRRFEVINEPDGHKKAAHFIALGIVLALIITVLVGLSSPLLINWLLPDSYATASQYAIGLVLVMLLKEMAEMINPGCFIGKTTGTQLLINTIGAIVGIVGMLWWTPDYAVWGIIFALLSAQALRLLLFFIASQYFLPLPYPARSLLIIMIISSGWLALGSQVSTIGQQLLLITAAMITLLATSLLLKLIPLPKMAAKKVFS